ncbi:MULTISPECIES: DUF3800 domain-containing protein [Paraburkholderia]|uniref:Uncharacterized protein n=1 Tax=Paraburkholderia dioscoreae TaxID=2604047 RepID=A0A5Q4ZBJ1_9BURK|nr:MULTISPECIES: DUF3800 domain-containing protein [Paraburkholderia]MDR8397044.1 DUF3800 domain-containing protein [Paraburkholderia sp. USG1]VVD27584.1 conserved protein of unknown function [Paraburkholderia dioscoreae]
MLTIDVNHVRQGFLKLMPSPGDKVIKRLYGVDEKMVFYYDETNNIRKLHLREDGQPNNREMKNFILGGIAHRTMTPLPDVAPLREALRIQKSAPEIKFDLIAKGDYLDILRSEKLKIFLQYLLNNRIYIHYYNLNLVYWSLVDIIDSLFADPRFLPFVIYHREIKNELHAIVSRDLFSFLALLRAYDYPNVGKKTSEFSESVLAFLNATAKTPRTPADLWLKSMLKEATKLEELAFLVDNESHVLIEGLHDFYVRPVCLFRKSEHIFDEELTVQKQLGDIEFMNGTRRVSFSFVNSKDSFGVQLSDVVCGLLGKHFNFIEENSMPELRKAKAALDETQRGNLKLLEKLIDVSDKFSNGMIYRTVPEDSDFKHQAFTFGEVTPPHLG